MYQMTLFFADGSTCECEDFFESREEANEAYEFYVKAWAKKKAKAEAEGKHRPDYEVTGCDIYKS